MRVGRSEVRASAFVPDHEAFAREMGRTGDRSRDRTIPQADNAAAAATRYSRSRAERRDLRLHP